MLAACVWLLLGSVSSIAAGKFVTDEAVACDTQEQMVNYGEKFFQALSSTETASAYEVKDDGPCEVRTWTYQVLPEFSFFVSHGAITTVQAARMHGYIRENGERVRLFAKTVRYLMTKSAPQRPRKLLTSSCNTQGQVAEFLILRFGDGVPVFEAAQRVGTTPHGSYVCGVGIWITDILYDIEPVLFEVSDGKFVIYKAIVYGSVEVNGRIHHFDKPEEQYLFITKKRPPDPTKKRPPNPSPVQGRTL